ncbi:hypothetical protein T4D_3347 [Trichinella pseudospiralis]|uniref:Uncharacterized protein n=1 Tax=Trichinella pseudospiralis TaxID=6337 RepID=A0A0V1FMD2_TRIPS|nr:hypothetical protein T4D_3347 [Trichinella pseudospiralis]
MKLGNLIHETNQVGQLLNVVRDVHFESEAAEKQQILILLNDRRAVRSGFNGRNLSLNQPLCWVAFNSQRHYRKVAEKKFEDLQGGFEHLRNTTKMKLGNLIHETNQVGQLLNVVRDVHFESEAAEKQQILILLNDRRAVRSGFNGRK